MNSIMKNILAITCLVMSTVAVAEVTFYERERFDGQSFSIDRQIGNFERFGFNDRVSSAIVSGERWEICEGRRFRGHCVVLRPGNYPSLAAMGFNERVSSAKPIPRNVRIAADRYAPVPVVVITGNAAAQIILFEQEGFAGRSFNTEERIANFARHGFNDRASSAVVLHDRWEVCENAGFTGRCVVLRPGRYPSLAAMGLNDRISSAREVLRDARIESERYSPPPAPIYDSRRHNNERLFEANVTAVRAVLGTPEQRCWVEQEQIAPERSSANIPAAIAGAVIGGVLGHQVGEGRGKDFATAGGAFAGGLLGANIGRGETPGQTRDVQRCANTPSAARPDYWDVSYTFRGQEHRVQMANPPGQTITVNERGEPRS